jgi:hypothetical protein
MDLYTTALQFIDPDIQNFVMRDKNDIFDSYDIMKTLLNFLRAPLIQPCSVFQCLGNPAEGR